MNGHHRKWRAREIGVRQGLVENAGPLVRIGLAVLRNVENPEREREREHSSGEQSEGRRETSFPQHFACPASKALQVTASHCKSASLQVTAALQTPDTNQTRIDIDAH